MVDRLNVEPTAQAIEEMAQQFEAQAKQLRRLADSMREEGDLSYAAEAATVVRNTVGSLRIDLLVTRSLRALAGYKPTSADI